MKSNVRCLEPEGVVERVRGLLSDYQAWLLAGLLFLPCSILLAQILGIAWLVEDRGRQWLDYNKASYLYRQIAWLARIGVLGAGVLCIFYGLTWGRVWRKRLDSPEIQLTLLNTRLVRARLVCDKVSALGHVAGVLFVILLALFFGYPLFFDLVATWQSPVWESHYRLWMALDLMILLLLVNSMMLIGLYGVLLMVAIGFDHAIWILGADAFCLAAIYVLCPFLTDMDPFFLAATMQLLVFFIAIFDVFADCRIERAFNEQHKNAPAESCGTGDLFRTPCH